MKSNAAELTTIVDYAVLDTRLDSHRQEVPAPIRLTEHYSLRGEVGAGGVGRVLLGFDERIGREVAVKEMHAPGSACCGSGRALGRVGPCARRLGARQHHTHRRPQPAASRHPRQDTERGSV